MNHAFLIMAHGHFRQLEMLLSQLNDKKAYVFLHIDKKAKSIPYDRFRKVINPEHLILLSQMDVKWGDSSQIICELNLIKAAVSHRIKFDYYHLLSGQDLLIKPFAYVDDFFSEHKGTEYVAIEHDDFHGNMSRLDKDKYQLYRFFCSRGRKQPWMHWADVFWTLQHNVGIQRDRGCSLNHGKGANWFSITDAFAKYLLAHLDIVESHFMHRTLCCDELFMQTVILNSPFKGKIASSHTSNSNYQIMRYIDWTRGRPYIFRKTDYSELVHSDMLFARKFDDSIDEEIVKLIYEFTMKS